MTEFPFSLFALSLGGGAVVALLALAARLFRARYAARWRCWVWLILCVRLAIPVTIPVPQLSRPVELSVPGNVVIFRPESHEPAAPPAELPSPEPEKSEAPQLKPELPAPEKTEPDREVTLFDAVSLLWLVGAAVVLGWFLVSHLRFLRYVSRWSCPVDAETVRMCNKLGDRLALDRRPRLRTCEGLKAPMLAGIARQTLLLPPEVLGEQDLRYILLHELTHFKRRDIWLKTLALWVTALHWFNPLMWYMTRLLERDMELACDEGVLRLLPQEEHSAYGKTILDAVERMKA